MSNSTKYLLNRVHSFGQPNQPYQPVFPKRIKQVDGRFWFRAFASLFSKRNNVFSQDLFGLLNRTAFLWKTTTKIVYFYCFLSKNRVTLCNVFSVHQINRLGGWLIWLMKMLLFFSVDMVDAKRMNP